MSTKNHLSPINSKYALIGITTGIAIVIVFGYGVIRYNFLEKELEQSHNSLTSTERYYQGKIKGLQNMIASSTEENTQLNSNLTAEQSKNDIFAQQINGITSTVNTLVKINNTDKELLQKYSKVYFLNENYVPNKDQCVYPPVEL